MRSVSVGRRAWRRIPQLAAKPRPGGGPIAFDRLFRKIEQGRHFLDGEPAEIPQLHDLRLARAERGQRIEGRVERIPPVGMRRVDDCHRLVEGDAALILAAAFFAPPAARVFHQDLPHQMGGDADKPGPVVPGGRLLREQPKIGLVDERGRLQRMPWPFAAQAGVRQPPQLVVDRGNERVVDGSEASRRTLVITVRWNHPGGRYAYRLIR
jgi:hypothetical protein